MKFLALITSFFLFLSPVIALSAEEVETEETPIVETVKEEETQTEETVAPILTPEQEKEIEDIVDRAVELGRDISTLYNTVVAIAGTLNLGAIAAVIFVVLKRLATYNLLIGKTDKVSDMLLKEVAAERKDIDEMRKTFMALLTMLNIDPKVKTTLIDRLGKSETPEEFAKAAKELQVETDTENIEEVTTLLKRISEEA